MQNGELLNIAFAIDYHSLFSRFGIVSGMRCYEQLSLISERMRRKFMTLG
jgi:hypothetical protein